MDAEPSTRVDAAVVAVISARAAQEELLGHTKQSEVARDRRDDAIRRASRLGVTRRQLASTLGMTPGRIQQIVDQGAMKEDEMRHIRPGELEQITATYARMADEARYRPEAPSDGFGSIAVPLDELDLEDEARRYALKWNSEENDRTFHVGVCNGPSRPATILALEAARNMCGGDEERALVLLQMAVGDLKTLLATQAAE